MGPSERGCTVELKLQTENVKGGEEGVTPEPAHTSPERRIHTATACRLRHMADFPIDRRSIRESNAKFAAIIENTCVFQSIIT